MQTDNTMDAVTVTGQRAEPRHVMGTREYILMLENLGDLHTRMAAQVYGEATQLDATRPSLASKLALVEQVLASMGMGLPAASAPRMVVNSPVAQPVQQPSAAAVGVPADGKQAIADVMAAVMAWARAWEQQDMPAYYAAYRTRFEPAQGTPLEVWKQERRERIVGRPGITVDFNDLRVQVDGSTATASFHQNYASGEYRSSARKSLQLQQEGGQWRIVREESGS